jgi:hypothetical protein
MPHRPLPTNNNIELWEGRGWGSKNKGSVSVLIYFKKKQKKGQLVALFMNLLI